MPSGKRHKEIAKRRRRYAKLAHLRIRYQKAKHEPERTKLEEKVRKLAPWLNPKEALKPTELTLRTTKKAK